MEVSIDTLASNFSKLTDSLNQRNAVYENRISNLESGMESVSLTINKAMDALSGQLSGVQQNVDKAAAEFRAGLERHAEENRHTEAELLKSVSGVGKLNWQVIASWGAVALGLFSILIAYQKLELEPVRYMSADNKEAIVKVWLNVKEVADERAKLEVALKDKLSIMDIKHSELSAQFASNKEAFHNEMELRDRLLQQQVDFLNCHKSQEAKKPAN